MSSHPQDLIQDAATLIQHRTGLALTTHFRVDLDSILAHLFPGDLAVTLAELRRSHETAPIWQQLMRALTIGETYFLRGSSQFRLLRESLLPQLITERRRKQHYKLDIWSAGCATGEEVYSIAIQLQALLPDIERWQIRLTGTDINAQALETAREGLYREWAFRHTDAHFRDQHFSPAGDRWLIHPSLRQIPTFQHANLLETPAIASYDLIFCRNVLIYFTLEHAATMEDILFNALKPEGWLLLSPSEAIHNQRERWQTHFAPGTVIYQKKPPHPAPVQFTLPTAPSNTPPVTQAEDRLYQQALNALREQQFNQAEQLLLEATNTPPPSAEACTLLAYLLANRNALAEAHNWLNVALNADKMSADAHYLRGALFVEAEQHDAAIQSLRAALYCQREHLLAALLLGSLYASRDDPQRALPLWQNAYTLASSAPADAFVSPLSDLRHGEFASLLQTQLKRLQA